MALLGIRTTLKQDYHCTSAELVYGTTLRVPSKFFTPNLDATVSDPSNYVTKLKESTKHFRGTPPCKQWQSTYMSKDLHSCIHTTRCSKNLYRYLMMVLTKYSAEHLSTLL